MTAYYAKAPMIEAKKVPDFHGDSVENQEFIEWLLRLLPNGCGAAITETGTIILLNQNGEQQHIPGIGGYMVVGPWGGPILRMEEEAFKMFYRPVSGSVS